MRKICSSVKCRCSSAFRLLRAGEIGAEGLLDDQPAPSGLRRAGQPGGLERLRRRCRRPTAESPGNRARPPSRSPADARASRAYRPGSSISPATKYICACSERTTSSLARVDLRELAQAVLELLAELLVAHRACGRRRSTANRAGSRWPRDRLYSAGSSLRRVRSPEAPKMTSVVAPGVGSMRRLSRSGIRRTAPSTSMIPAQLPAHAVVRRSVGQPPGLRSWRLLLLQRLQIRLRLRRADQAKPAQDLGPQRRSPFPAPAMRISPSSSRARNRPRMIARRGLARRAREQHAQLLAAAGAAEREDRRVAQLGRRSRSGRCGRATRRRRARRARRRPAASPARWRSSRPRAAPAPTSGPPKRAELAHRRHAHRFRPRLGDVDHDRLRLRIARLREHEHRAARRAGIGPLRARCCARIGITFCASVVNQPAERLHPQIRVRHVGLGEPRHRRGPAGPAAPAGLASRRGAGAAGGGGGGGRRRRDRRAAGARDGPRRRGAAVGRRGRSRRRRRPPQHVARARASAPARSAATRPAPTSGSSDSPLCSRRMLSTASARSPA